MSMKKSIYVILITLLIVLPLFSGQSNADREIARTQEYIAAATKQGQAKISALKAYVKKFPDKTKKWTKLAFYQLAVESFQGQKYADAVKYGDQVLKMGSPGAGEEGRLYLIIANSYGVKSASIFNKDTAIAKVNKAISFATQKKLNDVLAEAKKLKKQLSGPPPKKISPEQKIKMHYSEDDFSQAISFYKTLGAADKSNPEIHKTYANALFKARKYDSALKEFEALYAKDTQAIFAFRMADIYTKKARRNKALTDKAVDFYIEASLLYNKEGKASNGKAAYGKAEYQMFEKYGFNAKIKAYNKKLKSQQSSASKNIAAIAALKKKLKKHKRKIEREYERNDMAAPQYEHDKTAQMEKKLAALESGAPAGGDDAGAKLQEERSKIKKDLSSKLAEAKKRLGL
jgi:tetratricopeptide (TPR) repeat protein